MKRFLLSILAFGAMISTANAATMCGSGSLATYIALGSGGCMIGSDTLSGFQVLSGITGATPLTPSSLLITPGGGSTNPSLTFNTSAVTDALLEAIFTYRISGASFTGSTITLSNASNGLVTDIQNLCGAGIFGPDGVSNCTGTTRGPLVTAFSGSDQTTFPGVSFLTVSDDFTFDGSSGRATGGTFVDQFQAVAAVPEPKSVLLTTLGITLFLISRFCLARKRALLTNKETL